MPTEVITFEKGVYRIVPPPYVKDSTSSYKPVEGYPTVRLTPRGYFSFGQRYYYRAKYPGIVFPGMSLSSFVNEQDATNPFAGTAYLYAVKTNHALTDNPHVYVNDYPYRIREIRSTTISNDTWIDWSGWVIHDIAYNYITDELYIVGHDTSATGSWELRRHVLPLTAGIPQLRTDGVLVTGSSANGSFLKKMFLGKDGLFYLVYEAGTYSELWSIDPSTHSVTSSVWTTPTGYHITDVVAWRNYVIMSYALRPIMLSSSIADVSNAQNRTRQNGIMIWDYASSLPLDVYQMNHYRIAGMIPHPDGNLYIFSETNDGTAINRLSASGIQHVATLDVGAPTTSKSISVDAQGRLVWNSVYGVHRYDLRTGIYEHLYSFKSGGGGICLSEIYPQPVVSGSDGSTYRIGWLIESFEQDENPSNNASITQQTPFIISRQLQFRPEANIKRILVNFDRKGKEGSVVILGYINGKTDDTYNNPEPVVLAEHDFSSQNTDYIRISKHIPRVSSLAIGVYWKGTSSYVEKVPGLVNIVIEYEKGNY